MNLDNLSSSEKETINNLFKYIENRFLTADNIKENYNDPDNQTVFIAINDLGIIISSLFSNTEQFKILEEEMKTIAEKIKQPKLFKGFLSSSAKIK